MKFLDGYRAREGQPVQILRTATIYSLQKSLGIEYFTFSPGVGVLELNGGDAMRVLRRRLVHVLRPMRHSSLTADTGATLRYRRVGSQRCSISELVLSTFRMAHRGSSCTLKNKDNLRRKTQPALSAQ